MTTRGYRSRSTLNQQIPNLMHLGGITPTRFWRANILNELPSGDLRTPVKGNQSHRCYVKRCVQGMPRPADTKATTARSVMTEASSESTSLKCWNSRLQVRQPITIRRPRFFLLCLTCPVHLTKSRQPSTWFHFSIAPRSYTWNMARRKHTIARKPENPYIIPRHQDPSPQNAATSPSKITTKIKSAPRRTYCPCRPPIPAVTRQDLAVFM